MSNGDAFYTVEELRKRLSISTYVFSGHRPIGEGALDELTRCGIRRIELTESPGQFDMANACSMRFIGEVCRSCGVEVAAFHAHKMTFTGLDTEGKRREQVDRCRRQIDSLLELGGVVWGSHARDTDPTLVKCYQELMRHIEGTEAVIAVENFTREGLWVEDRMALLDEIDHTQVGMILDIGHVRNRDGTDPMCIPGGPTRVIEMCRSRLCHIHLHGFKDGMDHFPPFAEGDSIEWIELFRMLWAIGYRGVMNFEPAGEPTHHNAVQAVASVPERIVQMESETR